MKPTKRQIAQALGVSPPMICKYVKQGMPAYSVAAARQWREQHVDPLRRKEWLAYRNGTAESAPPAPPSVDLARIDLLFAAARVDFDRWQADLRAALRAVPHPDRPRVNIDPEVMRRLVEPHLTATADMPPEPSTEDPRSGADEFMRMFWFACAAWEIFPEDNRLIVTPAAAWVFDGIGRD